MSKNSTNIGSKGLPGIDWSPQADRTVACPVCSHPGPKRCILSSIPSWAGTEPLVLVACPECGCHFFPDLRSAAYETHPEITSFLKFYLEVGAGVDILAAPGFMVPSKVGSRYLDVGCGFGFGLDFARRQLGLDVLGVDPSPFAAAGREMLGLPISSGYLTPDSDLGDEPFELAVISEVIEHVFNPVDFIGVIARQLSPEGVLLLTTPYVGSIKPAISSGALLPLLSPGWHYVIYSEQAITRVLRAAGFKKIETFVRGHTLLAAATNGDRAIDLRRGADHRQFCDSLSNRIDTLPAGGALRHGLEYRLLKAHCNAGEYTQAMSIYNSLRPNIEAVYNFDIESSHQTWLMAGADEAFPSFAARYPMCLCGIGYLRGIIALNHDRDPARAEGHFDMAIRYGGLLRQRLQDIGSDDGETEVLAERSKALLLIAMAYRAPGEAAERALTAIDAAATSDTYERERRDADLLELLPHLVNLGALGEADSLASHAQIVLRRLGRAATSDTCRTVIDVRRALGALELRHHGSPRKAAVHYARAVRTAAIWSKLQPDSEEPRNASWRAIADQLSSLESAGDARRAERAAAKLDEPYKAGKLADDAVRVLENKLYQLRKDN